MGQALQGGGGVSMPGGVQAVIRGHGAMGFTGLTGLQWRGWADGRTACPQTAP